MPASDYTSTGGGALKLKGAGVDKKKKKKKHKPSSGDAPVAKDGGAASLDSTSQAQVALADQDQKEEAEEASAYAELSEELKRDLVEHKPKTEAERRYEERRRQRLHDRLKREGVKTHKERVEELNRYLSAQSEHHDMYVLTQKDWHIARFADAQGRPKIGPG